MNYKLLMENWRSFLNENKEEDPYGGCDPRYEHCPDPDDPEKEMDYYSDTREIEPNRTPDSREAFQDMQLYDNYNTDVFFRYTDWLELHGKDNDPFRKDGKGKYPVFPKKQSGNHKWPADLWVVRYGKLQGFDDSWENAPAICTRETGEKFIELIKILNNEPEVDSINLVFHNTSHARPSFDEWGSGTKRSLNPAKTKEVKGANQHKAGNAFDIVLPDEYRNIKWGRGKKGRDLRNEKVRGKMRWLEKVVDAAEKVGFTRFGFGLNNIHIDTKPASSADFMWVYASDTIYSGDILNYHLKPFNKTDPEEKGFKWYQKRDKNFAIVKKNARFLNYIPYLSDGLKNQAKNKWQRAVFEKARKAQAEKYKFDETSLAKDPSAGLKKKKKKKIKKK